MGPKDSSYQVSWDSYIDAVADLCGKVLDARRKTLFTQILLADQERQIEEQGRELSELKQINGNQRRALQAKNRKGTPGYFAWLRKFRFKNSPRLAALAATRATA